MITLNQELLSIDAVLYAPYNPRTITPEDLNRLKRSIQEFGVYTPWSLTVKPGTWLAVTSV
ncbi:MAG: hypothetical protein HQL22_12480 [Candidatus Omnitrophica bacterium]|nr:hypothetical protein [Candidatus Omnitrophota bacterium]